MYTLICNDARTSYAEYTDSKLRQRSANLLINKNNCSECKADDYNNLPSRWLWYSERLLAVGSHPLEDHQALLEDETEYHQNYSGHYSGQRWFLCWIHIDISIIDHIYVRKEPSSEGLTCFLCANCEFLTGLTLAYSIVGVHADAVNGGRVKVHDVGLIVCGRDVTSGMLQLPGIWQNRANGFFIAIIVKLFFYFNTES